MLPAFWFAFVEAAPAAALVANPEAVSSRLEQWYGENIPARDQVTVVRLADRCACNGSATDEFAQTGRRWASSPIRFIDTLTSGARLARAPVPPGVDVLIYSAQGRLHYAGPLQTPMCSASSGPIDLALRSLARDPHSLDTPLLLQVPCPCAG